MSATRLLARNILGTSLSAIPSEVKEHAKLSLLNWLGVTVGASRHPSVEMMLSVGEELETAPQVSILGREEKADLLQATLVNGMASHIFDFDDTHLRTIHHPSGPVAPVVFALGEKYGFSGAQLLHAFILGVETELRISNAVCPSHYDLGWHITSTAGVFGAAVAAAVLLELDEERLLYALGLAGTQAFGFREMFGTMTKPFHPGKAAQNGLLAALLAKRGFTSSQQVLEAKRGFASVTAPEHDLDQVHIGWGQEWELLKNAFKPYACGIVLHPSIDACIALREYAEPQDVKEIRLSVNPYVLELTGKTEPQTGLAGKFSVYHTGAIAFLEGDAAEAQYADEKVLDPRTVAFRTRIKPTARPELEEDQAIATLIRTDGSEHTVRIEHATGSIHNPMTVDTLIRKFINVTSSVWTSEQADAVIEVMQKLDELRSIGDVLAAMHPRQVSR